MLQINLLPVTEESTPALLKLVQAYYQFDQIEFDLHKARQAVLALVADDRLGQIWLIQAEDALIGYLVLAFGFSLEFGGRDAFMDEFFILENYRGQGIGKTVLTRLEPWLQELGIKALHLEVERENKAAQKFYLAQGFRSRARFHLMSKDL